MSVRVKLVIDKLNVAVERSIPADLPVLDIIENIINSLPTELQNAEAYFYNLFLQRGEKSMRLNVERTLNAQGVRDGDTLRFVPELRVAGWRDDRLTNEHKKITERFLMHPHVRVRVLAGSPPVKWEVTFRGIRGFGGRPNASGTPPIRTEHQMILSVDPRLYPDLPPEITLETPSFHPNIDPNRTVCVGQYRPGGPAWEVTSWLWQDAIVQTARMLQYQIWNLDSVFDSEAADYVREHRASFPLDDKMMV